MINCPQCGSADYGELDVAVPFDAPNLTRPGPHYIVLVCLDCEHCCDPGATTPISA